MLSLPETLQHHAGVAAEKSASLRTPGRFLVAGMLGGAYIGVGIVLMVTAAGPLIAAGDGFAKLVAGIVFGVALTLVVFAGADLATSAMMTLPLGALMRSVRPGRALVVLILMFACNLLGALLFSALVTAAGVLSTAPAAGAMLVDLLALKASLTPIELFMRGLLCNALVCLAVWMASRVQSPGAKITLIFLAITAFVTSGFEHVIANMTVYGLGLMADDPNATWAVFGSNMLWVGLGNLVGGGVLVGLSYWVIGGRPSTTETHNSADAARTAETAQTLVASGDPHLSNEGGR
ncbi:MAG: formate/nitrite transporter family protein [Microbacteriaceae bacterium]|nr:formate/nitrite transporter family protein [Microbacteriaceae bacterium]